MPPTGEKEREGGRERQTVEDRAGYQVKETSAGAGEPGQHGGRKKKALNYTKLWDGSQGVMSITSRANTQTHTICFPSPKWHWKKYRLVLCCLGRKIPIHGVMALKHLILCKDAAFLACPGFPKGSAGMLFLLQLGSSRVWIGNLTQALR